MVQAHINLNDSNKESLNIGNYDVTGAQKRSEAKL